MGCSNSVGEKARWHKQILCGLFNAMTRKDVYPLPRVDDILETLAGSRVFSTLDLASGY